VQGSNEDALGWLREVSKGGTKLNESQKLAFDPVKLPACASTVSIPMLFHQRGLLLELSDVRGYSPNINKILYTRLDYASPLTGASRLNHVRHVPVYSLRSESNRDLGHFEHVFNQFLHYFNILQTNR
jgi:hypothetical protein